MRQLNLSSVLLLTISFSCNVVFSQRTPSASSDVKSLNLAPDNIGAAQSTVNLFSGDVNLPVNLVSIKGKPGLDVNVSMVYNSNVQNQVDTWSLDSPTGILGLGWSMDVPKIVCDHKNTGTREDDTYYLIEGQASNRLICTGTGSDGIGAYKTYSLKSYQFWQIKFYYSLADYDPNGLNSTGPNKWVIVKENGFKYVYGDKNSNTTDNPGVQESPSRPRNTIQYTVRWNNWIGNSSNPAGQTQIATAWNLSEINNLWGEKVTFEYTNVEQFVGSSTGKKQTEASYLKQIVDPIGRKVQFFYKNKSSEFFMEPHTETDEPDAYQEVYEKQYLDHLDVLQEAGAKYLSVFLKYTSINTGATAKMLLSEIEQRNASGQSLPPMKFDYYPSTGTMGYKGFLQKVTYPTGGTMTYTYAMTNNAIGHSNRSLAINRPTGYAEPNIWYHDDYAVVAWRALGSGQNGNHITDPMPVKLKAYRWVGEWISSSQEIMFPSVRATFVEGDANVGTSYGTPVDGSSDWANTFQIVLEDNFFGVLTQYSGNTYQLTSVVKDETVRGDWLPATTLLTQDFGTTFSKSSPSLLSADNFLAVGSNNYGINYPSKVFIFNGIGFNPPISINGTYSSGGAGHAYFSSADNYLFIHNELAISDNHSALYFLNEQKILSGQMSFPSTIDFNGYPSGSCCTYQPSRFFGSNSYLVAMAAQNPEYIYRWDLNYSNFKRDNQAGSILGSWNDQAYVFNIDNSMVGLIDYRVYDSDNTHNRITGMAARFDGSQWITSPLLSSVWNWYTFTFGSDFAAYIDVDQSTQDRVEFNPNSNNWVSTLHIPGIFSLGAAPGRNSYNLGGSTYYRKQNGDWIKIGDGPAGPIGQGFLLNGGSVQLVKNGALGSTLQSIIDPIVVNRLFYDDKDQFGMWIDRFMNSSNTIGRITIPSSNAYYAVRDAFSVILHRVVNDGVDGLQVDYPVNTISVSGSNSQDQNISIEYAFSSATLDPTGSVAQYGDVNVIPGTLVADKTKSGYTKTLFYNGLTNDFRWRGLPYQVEIHNVQGANDLIVSKTTTSLTSTNVVINNSTPSQTDIACYVRPNSITKMADGFQTITSYTYDANSGQVRSTTVIDDHQTIVQEYIYGYEKYTTAPLSLAVLNLLTPVVQVSKKVNAVYTEAQVTRYKNWNALNFGGGGVAPAPFDQLTWKGTNNSQFSAWDTSTPASSLSDWSFEGQAIQRDDYTGSVLCNVGKGNSYTAAFLDQYKIRTVAQVINGTYGNSAYSSFEDNAQGNWGPPDGVPVTSGALTGNRYLNIGTTGQTKAGLTSSQSYTLSFWAKSSNGTLSIDGVGSVTIAINAWTYYEYTVTGITSLNIRRTSSGIDVSIDELRVCPARATVASSSYDLVYGVISECSANNRIQYTNYDSWGRLQSVTDESGNILKLLTYNLKK